MGEEEQSVKMEQQTTDDGVQRKGPMIVSFPKKQPDHLLKLEVEDVDQGMNPRNIWQVYALGGFMIIRWLYARWQERRMRRRQEEEDSD